MSLELDPVELGFRRPFDREVEEKLRLRNMNSDPVAFKVKTTAPKQYCVRPNSGRIEPGETVEVSVLLQKMTEEPPLEYKCRDKFLVQSVAVSASDEIGNVQAVWSNIEQNARSSIQEKKIRVNFLPASSNGVSAGAYSASTPSRQSTSAYGSEDQPPAYSSPALNQTPQSSYVAAGASSASKYNDTPAGNSRSVGDAVNAQPAIDPTTSSNMATGTLAAAANTITSAVPTSTEQLKAQLAEAQNQISSLTQQASEGLRQRKNAATSKDAGSVSTSNSGMAMQAPAGVPVPLVAALCLLSFLLAYLLF